MTHHAQASGSYAVETKTSTFRRESKHYRNVKFLDCDNCSQLNTLFLGNI